MLNLADLLRVPNIDNSIPFDISPDGQRIAFAWNKTGAWEIYEISLTLALSQREREFHSLESSLKGAKFAPRYSRDGNFLAYALDINGGESYQIAIYNLQTHTEKNITPNILYAHQPNFSWSPDGNMLAVLSDKHGQFALHLIPTDGSGGRMIKNVFRPCWDAQWSPDGQWIAIEAESTGSDRSLYIMPINRPRKGGLKIKTIQLQMNAQQPVWSPDSKTLAFSAEHGEWHDIGLFNIETQEITWANESAGDDTQPTWSHAGEMLAWIHSDGARNTVELKSQRGIISRHQVGAGVHSFPRFVSDGIVIVYEDINHPSDLWKINVEDNAATQLTKSLSVDVDFTQPAEITYASKDGTQIPALLYRAENAKGAVIDIHGGPNWHVQFLWNPFVSYLVAQGITVLAPNYRGSTGYGKTWQNASRYDMGGIDTDDCAASTQYLIENDLANKNKIAVTGRSHGGYLTMTCMTTYPQYFAGGSAVVPFLNWIKSHKNSREDLQHWNIENMGDPADNAELWHARSPYFFLDQINAPVQLICGGNDPRCPASDSIDAHEKLKVLDKEVELLLYKDEGHIFLKIENIVGAETKRVDFLLRVLGNGN